MPSPCTGWLARTRLSANRLAPVVPFCLRWTLRLAEILNGFPLQGLAPLGPGYRALVGTTNSLLTLQHADLLNSVLRKQVLIQLLHFLGRMPHPLSYDMRWDSSGTDKI